MNLKLALWYIERKQAKRALENYECSHVRETDLKPFVSFILSEIKCVDNIEKNMDRYLDAFMAQEMDKIGIMKDNALVAVMMPIEHYEQLLKAKKENP